MNRKKRFLTLAIALFMLSIPLFAIVSGQSLTSILKDLWTEMQLGYVQRSEAQERFIDDYERQHQKLMDMITKSNELSIPGLWRKQPECLTDIQGAVLVKPRFDSMPEAIALIS